MESGYPDLTSASGLLKAQEIYYQADYLIHLEWLSYVTVGARLDSLLFVGFLGFGAEHDNVRFPYPEFILYDIADFEPIHLGHHYIEKNNFRSYFADHINGVKPVVGRKDFDVQVLQYLLNERTDQWFVVYYQYSLHRSTVSLFQ